MKKSVATLYYRRYKAVNPMKLFQFRPQTAWAGGAGASGSRTQILYWLEPTGTPPNGFAQAPPTEPTAGAYQVRFTKSSINHQNTTAPSAEIRTDRMRADLLLLSYAANGGFDSEWTSYNLDPLREAALCGTAYTGVFPGTPAAWNTIPVVTTASTLRNGALFRSYCIEQGFTDISRFIAYRGMAVEEWDLNITARAIIMETFTFMGVSGLISSASVIQPPPAILLPNSNTPITAGPSVVGVELNNTLINGACVRSLQFKVKNNMRERTCVQTYESGQFGFGFQDITGTLEMYFENSLAYQAMLGNTNIVNFTWQIQDNTTGGSSYTFNIPKMKIETSTQQITGSDADIMQALTWRALADPSGYQMSIARSGPHLFKAEGESADEPPVAAPKSKTR